jgi:hypothetical protein
VFAEFAPATQKSEARVVISHYTPRKKGGQNLRSDALW